MKKILSMFVCLALAATSAFSTEWFVSQTTGKKKGPGTKEAPFKAIFDAVKKAQPGDVIFMAAGTYTGAMGASEIVIDKPLAIVGGYSTDFATRDLIKFPTLIQPLNEKNDSKGLGVISLKLPAGPGPDMIIDGIVIDQGFMNSYHAVKGKPEGVETGMWLEPPAKGPNDKFGSAKSYSIFMETAGRHEGNLIIQNCLFANAGNFAINVSKYKGSVRILNNVFVASRMEACDVMCSSAAGGLPCEFAYNSVLFTWSRTDELSDMGYGFRCREKVAANIHHNLFAFNIMAGVGNDIGNSNNKKIALDHNVFMLNRQADVTVTKSPSILSLKVGSDEFDDLEDYPGMESVEENIAMKDPEPFKAIINQAYLKGFLQATYSEKLNYGDGTMTSKVSMYANRYPLDECYKFIGAVQGYGAQFVK